MAISGHLLFYSTYFSHSIRCVAFILLCVSSFVLSAQRLPKGESLTIEDGLSFRDVTAIAQDNQGLMWFGTRQGLNRYDGYRFTRFGNDRQADQFFPGENIQVEGIQFIYDNILYLISDHRLYSIQRNDFSQHDLTKELAIKGSVLQLKFSPDGSIWMVCEDATQQYLYHGDHLTALKEIAHVPRIRREFVTSLAIDTSGDVWWSTISQGLRQYNKQGDMLHEIKVDSFLWYGTMMYYTPIHVDSRNRIIIFPKSRYQIWWYHPEEKRYDVIADSLSTVASSFEEDKQHNLWFSSNVELLRWSPERVLTDYTSVLNETLQFGKIQDIYEDQTNMLWIATDNGLIKFPNQKQLFKSRFDVPGDAWGNAMRGIFEDKQGRIFAYCETGNPGLYYADTPNGPFYRSFIPIVGNPKLSPLDGTNHFIPDLDENVVWTLTDKLVKIDLDKKHVISMTDFSGTADTYWHNPFLRLKSKSFLLGSTLERMIIYNPETGERTKFLKETNTQFSSVHTECLLENSDGSVWVGTNNEGLYLISGQGNIIRHLTTGSTPALSNNHILVVHLGADSVLWIGTFGGGLNKFDLNNNSIQSFTIKDGLANENVVGILSDQIGNIWASTYNGLSCYRIKEGTFQNFFEDDGLSNNEFNYSSFFKDRNGVLWFGGMNGLQYFNPQDILEQRPNPPLTFTGYLKYNRQRDSLDSRVLGSQEIEPVIISPYDSYFQFTWTLPNYFKSDKNRYYVWLEGLEDDWSYIGNTPIIRYHKLPEGNFTLHIKGADSKGNWSKKELEVPIHVNPFFFKTWWFILGCIFLVGGLVFAFTRYRLQRLLEMERMRTRIAGDLHDEVGSMLSGLAMQAEILELDQHKSDTSRLHRISEISRLTLSKMRDVVWSIDSRRDQVKDLLDRMREHAEEMLTPKEMTFQFELGELPLEKKLQVDVRQHLFLFFKEAITNIVKHSNATIVTIRFGQFGDHFELSIEDNGTPTISSAASSGFGLQNLEMRAKKIGAIFQINRVSGFHVMLSMKSL